MPYRTIQQQRLGAVFFYLVIALLLYFTYLVFEPFLVPLCWAAVLAVVLDPLNKRLDQQWGRTRAAIACTILVTLLLIAPAIGVGISFVHQGLQAAAAVQRGLNNGGLSRVDRWWEWLGAHIPGQTPESLAQLLHRAIEATATFLASKVGVVLRNVAIFVFDLVVAIIAMFYFFRDSEEIMARLRQVLPFDRESREEIVGKSRDLIFASVTMALAAAAIHGLAGGVAFAIVGITAPVFWGVAIAFFSLLPVVGDLIIWVPAIIDLFFTGHWIKAVVLAVIVTVVAGVIDNIIRPWFISGRTRMNGLIVFIAVLGGVAVFGLLGIVLGPIIVATFASLLDLYAKAGRRTESA
ncbi:MAG TPA: AI-2E family transporter [Candidatus Acidoferrales bacterium]|nr:AI-2E family transporter [Candidatus Acidoferrales bacterium]